MTSDRLTPWLIGGVLVLLIAGITGWAFGAGAANGRSDARSAREEGFRSGFGLVFKQAHDVTARRGFVAGASRGKRAGKTTGSREGAVIGAGNAEIEEAVASQKSAESAASAAESEIAARQPNCGILPAAPSWCPTSDELAAYKEAVQAAKEAAAQAAKEKEKQAKQGAGNGRN